MDQGTEKPPKDVEASSPRWFRVTEVVLGLALVVVSIVVLANLDFEASQLATILAVALMFSAVRMVATGGIKRGVARFRAVGLVGGGVLAMGAVVVVVLVPTLSFQTLVFLLSISLTIQGIGRVFHSSIIGRQRWLRGSALATGIVTIVLAGVALLVPGLAELTLVPILSVLVLVNGVEMTVSGLRPKGTRQLTLLKLVLFSAFYGLVLINWVDLFANTVPAYHIWLVMTYMAPFGVLIVFQGFKDWQLALSLGLLVSLMNDVGYYFVGDLLFGFHRALVPWVQGQLGFQGGQVLFNFQGGFFTIPVTSTLMGITVYGRVLVVAVVLYTWWKRPAAMSNPL